MKIGLLVGREYSFPPAFLARVNELGRARGITAELAVELLAFVDDVVDELGSRKALDYVHTICKEGTSADRQLQVYKQTGDLREVVRWLVEETRSSSQEVV